MGIRKFRRYIIVFFVLAFSSLAGTHGQIKGKIVDAKTGKPLSYINVIVVGTSLGVDCKNDGFYHIMNVPSGTYEVQFRGIGYLPLTVKNVVIEADHITVLNIKLFFPETFEGKYVTEETKIEIIKMDIPSKRYYSNIEEISKIPMVLSLYDYLSFVNNGEKIDSRVLFESDGFPLVDNRINSPILVPPLSAVRDVVVIKSGFDVEYGNMSSYVVNIIEQEGERNSYHGSANFYYTFSHMPHYGSSIFSPDNVHIRPFVDTADSLCWKGISVLPEEDADEYKPFEGWIEYAERGRERGDTLTPEEWRNLFMYVCRVEGSESLGQIPGSYGEKAGKMFDFSFGGPFPGIDIITFFVSHSRETEPFSLPVTRENYYESKTDWNITFHLKPGMKFNIKSLFESINTVTTDSREIYYNGEIWAQSGNILHKVAGKDFMYWVDVLNPYNIKRYGCGLNFNHSISSSTYYDFKLFFLKFTHSSIPVLRVTDSGDFRDTTELISFGSISIPEETPFGYESFAGNECVYRDLLPADFIFSTFGRAQYDTSRINTINFNSEITSAVSRQHVIKGGIQVNYDRINSYLAAFSGGTGEVMEEINWSGSPLRAGFYVQDKFSGDDLFARFGLRLDYYNPDKNNPKWKLIPRLGMSFPLGNFSKIYFNFGKFYELPETEQLLGRFNNYMDSTEYIGNPRIDLPEVVSYEIGFEREFLDRYSFHVSGYFNDYDNQIGETNLDNGGDISYVTYANDVYGNIKGFEFSLRNRYGKFFKGSFVYNFETGSYGRLGYEDVQVKASPDFRLLLIFTSPDYWGKVLKNISASFLYTRKGGEYFSYDPYASEPFSPDDPTYINNLKWEDEGYWDLRLSKSFNSGRLAFSFFIDVNNIFDAKYLNGDLCFRADHASTDKLDYFRSLHLPMYKDERYAADTLLIGGNDKVGEVDKDYIDKPALEYLYYTNPRFLQVGLRIDF
jgi:outer membrane receptor protein involved in Fe transport